MVIVKVIAQLAQVIALTVMSLVTQEIILIVIQPAQMVIKLPV